MDQRPLAGWDQDPSPHYPTPHTPMAAGHATSLGGISQSAHFSPGPAGEPGIQGLPGVPGFAGPKGKSGAQDGTQICRGPGTGIPGSPKLLCRCNGPSEGPPPTKESQGAGLGLQFCSVVYLGPHYVAPKWVDEEIRKQRISSPDWGPDVHIRKRHV